MSQKAFQYPIWKSMSLSSKDSPAHEKNNIMAHEELSLWPSRAGLVKDESII